LLSLLVERFVLTLIKRRLLLLYLAQAKQIIWKSYDTEIIRFENSSVLCLCLSARPKHILTAEQLTSLYYNPHSPSKLRIYTTETQ